MNNIEIHWLIRGQVEQVLKIEQRCFESPWDEETLLSHLRQRNCIGLVGMRGNEVLGYVVYHMLPDTGSRTSALEIIRFAVSTDHRRDGVGSKMLEKLVGKLAAQRRQYITVHVRETNLSAQFFLRECGFNAVEVVREHYDDSGEDAYVFEYEQIDIHQSEIQGVME